METRFKTLLDETFNAHSMRTRNKSIQLEELFLSDLDTQFALPGPKPHCVLVFDTETTGLIQKSLLPLQPNHLDSYPYITQLSAVLYDVDNQKVKRVFNTYVKIPDDRLYEDYYFIRYITAKSKFPEIKFHLDPIARCIGAVPGDIIKITRPSASSGQTIIYRVCAP
jgi:DNA-directed RNA polymerase subunit H (RpoH/RPB5)